jgi:hypothetical protein
MKITIDIPDSLLREIRKLAQRESVPLPALVERGLYRILAESKQGTPFKLRRASFKGRGLQAAVRGASWHKIRALAYGDHGNERG